MAIMDNNRNFNSLQWQCKILQLLLKIVWQLFKNLNTHFSCDPAISFLSIYSSELKTYIHMKDWKQIYVVLSFITPSKRIKKSFNKWMDKQTVLYTYNGILLSKKTNKQTKNTVDSHKRSQIQSLHIV